MKEEIDISFHLNRRNYDEMSFEVKGTIENKIDYTRIIFDEPLDEGAKTVVDIYDEKIILKRFGKVKTKMEYSLNEETFVSITTDFGYELNMLNHTKTIEKNHNYIHVIYQTEADLEQGLEHELVLNWNR
jgi:domain of unknown function (DUF1934)